MADVNDVIETNDDEIEIFKEEVKVKKEKKADPVKELKKQLKTQQATVDELIQRNAQLEDYNKALQQKLTQAEEAINSIVTKYSKDTKFIADSARVLYMTIMNTLKETV